MLSFAENRSIHTPESAFVFMARTWMRTCCLAGIALFTVTPQVQASNTQDSHWRDSQAHGNLWVGTWSATPQAPNLLGNPAIPAGQANGFTNQTVRNIAHISIGGNRLRVRLTNAYGTTPLVIGAAHVALRREGAAIVPSSDRTLTFSGSPSIVIPPGAIVLSDPVALNVPARSDLAISIYVPGPTGLPTIHWRSLSTNFISTPGDFTAATTLPIAATEMCPSGGAPPLFCGSPSFYLAGVEVLASNQAAAIVAFGDSLTDSYGATVDANRRWPDVLAERLLMRKDAARKPLAVLNAGIAGNGIIASFIADNGLARFDRDVLSQSGVEFLIVLFGTNDLRAGVTAEQMIAAYRQIIDRAHAHGITVLGSTIPPFNIAGVPDQNRQQVNRFLRTSDEFDGLIDFDAAIADPGNPGLMLPAYDSGDHLHLNDAGYRAMGNVINLRLFDSH